MPDGILVHRRLASQLTLSLPQGFSGSPVPRAHTQFVPGPLEADLAQKINRYEINGEFPSSRSDCQWEVGGAATA
jgi:hypothetical protein